MLTIIITLATVLALFSAVAILVKSSFELKNVTEVLTDTRYELARKYAALFGLDNESVEFDIEAVIEMGRKCEEYLGSDKLEEIHAAITEQDKKMFHITTKSRIKARRCQVNKTVRVSGLVMVVDYAQVFTKTISGGNKDGEPSISI